MRVGIDVHHLDGKPQGSRTYLLGLLRALAALAPADLDVVLYSFVPERTRALLSSAPFDYRRVFPESARVRLPFVVPWLELRDGLDVLHSQYVCPPVSPAAEVVTIHDILFETHPELFEGAFSRASVWLVRRSARRARFVLTVSEFSRRALVERYGLDPDRVVVTPDAVDPERFRPIDDPAALEAVRRRYELPATFLLFVGRLEPRKNLLRLLAALDRVRARLGDDVVLVLVGPADFRSGPIREAIARREGAVRWVGPVPDEELAAFYSLARGLVYPSLVEGFGMPVLEAMACGTPVAAARRGALPEVAGDAALWCEPEDEESIAAAAEALLADEALAARLRARGRERAARFRWEETARRTLDVYRAAATNGVL